MTSSKAATILPQKISNSLRPILKHPQTFKQLIRQSDGSTFRIKTTSPKSMQTLTKDTLNHHIWNPSKATLTDTSGQLEKFNKRFGAQSNKIDSELKEDAWKSNERDVSSENIGKNQIDELLELAVGEAPKITEKKVIVKVVETTAAKGKAAKAKVAKK